MALMFALVLATASTAFAQAQISGTVTDAETGEGLPGANVIVLGTSLGAATDADGRYTIAGAPAGTHVLRATFVGYEPAEQVATVRNANVTVNFGLDFSSASLEALEIFASRAVDRKTPVAYTNVEKVQIQRELGSRDTPMVLNTTPSVYATMQGGGSGDARINVRGFDQRNVAVMINGVPVNDMENGWVYWSNWDGVGDATSSIQLQRGLAAVNLATPSIGGTLNILTDPAALARSVKVKQEFGNDGFLKSTATLNTGLINNKFAATLSGVRKTGDGYYYGTWTDAWAYYGAVAYNINERHRVDLYAVGAPQRHGQNLYKQNIAAYDHGYAREVFGDDVVSDGFIDDILNAFPEAEDGRRWNENASDADGYTADQNDGWGTVSRYDDSIFNERENFFHKPQVNLNYYGQLNDRTLLSTVLYYSGGKGGGSGTFGSMGWDYSGPSRRIDVASTLARNQANGSSRGFMRNSHNVQWTIGGIAKLAYDVSETLKIETGLDWRTAEIQHYRTIRDLMGGSHWTSSDNDFWGGSRDLVEGDKFNYNNTNTVDWLGYHVQAEQSTDAASYYAMAGMSTVKYSFTDHFRDAGDGTEFFAETDRIWGGQVKGGALVNMTDEAAVFVNAGFVSKVPIVDAALDDVTGIVNPDPKNEKFTAFEAGWQFRSMDMPLAAKVNVYYTAWSDRTITQGVTLENGEDAQISLLGLDQLHKGVEMEVSYQPFDFLRFDAGLSLGDWTYQSDVSARFVPDAGDPSSVQFVNLYTDNLYVGDAPQNQAMYGVTVYPVDGMYAKLNGRSYDKHYAFFDPLGRTNPDDRAQSWQAPGYSVFDLHLGYDIPAKLSRLDIRVFANVFNVFDSFYIQDAVDNSPFNAYRGNGVTHSADDAEVFLGLPRQINFGTNITFR